MKTLESYISDNINEGGHYETKEFVDPDTEEVVQVTRWVEDPDPEAEMEKIKKAKEQETQFRKAQKLQQEYYKKLNPLENELYAAEQELKDTIQAIRTTKMDMEEEVGQYYINGDEAGGEKAAQKYGEELDRLENNIDGIRERIKKAEAKIEALHRKYDKIWDF